MLRDAWLVAGRDLRIEWRARVTLTHTAPFAVTVLVLFAFALDPDRGVLGRAAAGLLWTAALLGAVLAVQRAASVESTGGLRDALRMTVLEPPGIFLGRVAALAVQLVVLVAVLVVGVVVLYGAGLRDPLLFGVTAVAASVGLAAVGTLYGTLAAGLRARETLLPLLLVPVASPVLVSATRATEQAFGVNAGGVGGWSWVQLLVVFAVMALVGGSAAYGVLLEEP